MKEVLKKLRDLEAEMEEAENQSEYWMEEEHLDLSLIHISEPTRRS